VEQLIQEAKKLLEENKVDVVIGYRSSPLPPFTRPAFIRRPEDCEQLVFNCGSVYNLTRYLIGLGEKPAIVVKGCEQRGLVVLEQENMLPRDSYLLIGVGCSGQVDERKLREGGFDRLPEQLSDELMADKCLYCDQHNTPDADIFIGDEVESIEPQKERYAGLDEFFAQDYEELYQHWTEVFSRCIRCYACRNICPLCYCEQCISYVNMPQWLPRSVADNNNYLFHMRRVLCMAGRCIDCGECERACPVDIPLRTLYKRIAQKIEGFFYGYRAGYNREQLPPLQDFNKDDSADFIL